MMRNRKLQKNSKKIQKIKKYHYGFISSQNRMENTEKDIKKIYYSVSFLPNLLQKIRKKLKKKLRKLKKYHYGIISFTFLPDGLEKIPKKSKKIKKKLKNIPL